MDDKKYAEDVKRNLWMRGFRVSELTIPTKEGRRVLLVESEYFLLVVPIQAKLLRGYIGGDGTFEVNLPELIAQATHAVALVAKTSDGGTIRAYAKVENGSAKHFIVRPEEVFGLPASRSKRSDTSKTKRS